jgi:hypothetical protein
MTATTGTVGHHNVLSAQWSRDVDEDVIRSIGDVGNVHKLFSQVNTDDVRATEAEWIVEEHAQPFTTLSATPSDPDVDLVISVVEAAVFGIGDIAQHATSQETGRVADRDLVANTITLESRSRGDNAAANWASGDTLINLGSAKDDGDDLGEALTYQDVMYENPIQLYWERIEFDGTTVRLNEKRGIYGGDYVTRKRKAAMTRMLQQMDMNVLTAEAATSAGVASDSVRTHGGIRPHIDSANVTTMATATRANIENFLALRPDMRLGDGDLTIVTSDWMLAGFNRFADSTIQYKPGGKEVGFAISTIVTPFGRFNLMSNYNLSKISEYKGLALLINLAEIEKATLLPLTLYGGIGSGLVDKQTDAYMGQHTYKLGAPGHHGEINGVTAFS